jgi:hypothetical protein
LWWWLSFRDHSLEGKRVQHGGCWELHINLNHSSSAFAGIIHSFLHYFIYSFNIYMCIHICTYTYIYICMHIQHMYVYTCMHTHICIYVTHIYMYMHTHTHTHNDCYVLNNALLPKIFSNSCRVKRNSKGGCRETHLPNLPEQHSFGMIVYSNLHNPEKVSLQMISRGSQTTNDLCKIITVACLDVNPVAATNVLFLPQLGTRRCLQAGGLVASHSLTSRVNLAHEWTC